MSQRGKAAGASAEGAGPQYEDMTIPCGVENCLNIAVYKCVAHHTHRGQVAEEWEDEFPEENYVDHPRYVCTGHKRVMEKK